MDNVVADAGGTFDTAVLERPVSGGARSAAARRQRQLIVHVDRIDGVLVITPVGEIDSVTGDLFLEALLAAVAAGELRLVVDLQRVPFMDSTVLAVLLSVDRAARMVGGRIRLVAGPSVADILETAGIGELFPIEESLADGVAAATRG